MPSNDDIVTFHDGDPPDGETPWLPGVTPELGIEIADPDPGWVADYDHLASEISRALGWRALSIEHVGSTAVSGLPAKPIIDIDLIVADPNDETAYIAPLTELGFELRVREPWWFGHRALRHLSPHANLHVFGYDSPEPIKHRIFRDWLRGNADDRELYAATKREVARISNSNTEHSMQYNARKESVIREIYQRAFRAGGLIPDEE